MLALKQKEEEEKRQLAQKEEERLKREAIQVVIDLSFVIKHYAMAIAITLGYTKYQ